MTTVIADYSRRTKRAWQADGIYDMAIGSAFLCLALIFLNGILMVLFLQTHGPQTPEYSRASAINIMATSALQLLVAVPFFFIEPLKRRFVYPKFGYMQLRVQPKGRRTSLALVSALFILTIGGVSFALVQATPQSHDPFGLSRFWTADRTVVSFGVGIGIALVVNYLKFGYERHLVVAAVCVTASLLLLAVHDDWEHKMLILSTVVGASLLIVGGMSFAKMLCLPVVADKEQEAQSE